MRGGIYMKGTSLMYNNSLTNKENFINTMLSTTPKNQIPICEIKETPDFYSIKIDSFDDDNHVLEISYKNNFLILKIRDEDTHKKFLLERIFYLKNIDSNNILLHDHKTQLKLIIPKILQS
jgi:HSP20 family molecular chaperone IbpA